MGFDLGPKENNLKSLLLTPGPILTVIGLLILTASFVFFSDASPGGDVDALIEAKSRHGDQIKSMIAMVAGVLVSIAGVLLSLVTFSQRNR